MKPRILVLFAAGLLVAADPPKEDLVKEEAAKLQGAWEVVSAEELTGGLPKDLKLLRVVVKDDVMTFERMRQNTVCQLTLDPTTKPKKVDLKIAEGRLKGNVMEGIYSLDGDELRLCYNHRAQKGGRPAEFANDFIEKGTSVVVLKRSKP